MLRPGIEYLQTSSNKRYEAATRFTDGTVFGRGDGHLGEVVRDKVIWCNTARINSDIALVEKKKKDFYVT